MTLFWDIFRYWLSRFIRSLRGNTRVLSVVLEFPDLPRLDDATIDYIERLTAGAPELPFGSLSHYVKSQSHGRANLEGSAVVRLGTVLPPWEDLFDPPPEPGLPPVERGYRDFRVRPIIERRLRTRLLEYDILLLFYGGLLPQNAHAGPLPYILSESILATALEHHPEGYVLEVRARKGYDANLHDSGVLVHKLAWLNLSPTLGLMPFLLGPIPPVHPPYWPRYVLTSGERLEREGLLIEVSDVTTGPDGVPEIFDLDVTVQ